MLLIVHLSSARFSLICSGTSIPLGICIVVETNLAISESSKNHHACPSLILTIVLSACISLPVMWPLIGKIRRALSGAPPYASSKDYPSFDSPQPTSNDDTPFKDEENLSLLEPNLMKPLPPLPRAVLRDIRNEMPRVIESHLPRAPVSRYSRISIQGDVPKTMPFKADRTRTRSRGLVPCRSIDVCPWEMVTELPKANHFIYRSNG